ncbi:hypothetical protein ACQEVG_16240 [Streptomyces sp. CA-135486]|uniref:hypothetical protein n=1 Tax=Streptomyces sp. CA-135486 TaxID=3240049 RepID=UPI003D905212
MDLESVTDELYELRPQDFTAARNERAAAARKEGNSDLAHQIKDLRRPTLSAWAGNLLVRRRPQKAQSLISLGEGLRQAHRNLDGEQLRELGRRQHAVVGALAREARQLAQAAGQPISDEAQQEIEATLHAVLADPQAAQEWATGHLARPLSPPIGFTEAVRTAVPQRKPPARPAGRKQEPRREQEQQEREQEQEQEKHRKVDQARKDARAAEEEAHTLEAEKKQTAAEKERAEDALKEAEERASALARELKDAQQQRQATRNSAREARDRAQAADRAAGAARRKAQRAAEAAERLAAERP